jgi:hypothetical protein
MISLLLASVPALTALDACRRRGADGPRVRQLSASSHDKERAARTDCAWSSGTRSRHVELAMRGQAGRLPGSP